MESATAGMEQRSAAEVLDVRCQGCGAAISAATWEPLACACRGCRRSSSIRLPVHEQPSAHLGVRGMLQGGAWLEALTSRVGARDVIVGACRKCEGPLAAPAEARLSVRCGHCRATRTAALTDFIADALPQAHLQLDARGFEGTFSLEWSFEHVITSVDARASCPGCGAPVEPFEGSTRCTHCARTLHAVRRGRQRILPGVRVRGEGLNGPVDQWMPLAEGAAHYRQHRDLWRRTLKLVGWMAVGTGASTLGLLGCLVVAKFLFILFIVGWLVHLAWQTWTAP